MTKLIYLSAFLLCLSFVSPHQSTSYMLIMLKPIPACEGKCNNYEIVEYPQKSAEACKVQIDSCKAKFGDKPTYFTVAPGEAAIYFKYNKFVANCDCKILGVHVAATAAKAKEEMETKIAEERVKKPKAFHNYEVYSGWPR